MPSARLATGIVAVERRCLESVLARGPDRARTELHVDPAQSQQHAVDVPRLRFVEGDVCRAASWNSVLVDCDRPSWRGLGVCADCIFGSGAPKVCVDSTQAKRTVIGADLAVGGFAEKPDVMHQTRVAIPAHSSRLENVELALGRIRSE